MMDRSGAASILSAVEKLQGEKTTVRSRTEGLEDLRRTINQFRDSSSRIPLKESHYHQIFEILFDIVRTDKPNHAKAAAASRLSTAATALRLIVEVSRESLKHKTVISLLDHVVDTLPFGKPGYCLPVQSDYLRAFRQLLEYAPHAEHLRPKEWQAYVEFILKGIYSAMQSNDQDDSSDNDNQTRTMSRQNSAASRNARSMSIRVSQSSRLRSTPVSTVHHVDDMLASLYCLANVPHAPRAANIVSLCDAMLTWIETAQTSYDGAFAVLNTLIPVALSENLDLVSMIFSRSSGQIQRLWTIQYSHQQRALRDQMLITLYYTRYIYMNDVFNVPVADAATLDSLIASIWSDLEKRRDRDNLHLEDLDFVEYSLPMPMSLRGISPSSDNPRVTTAWSTFYVLSLLVIALDRRRQTTTPDGNSEGPRKRQRVENSIDDIIQRAHNSTGQARLTALQLLLFVIDRLDVISFNVLEQIRCLTVCLSDDDPSVVSWTFILLARCAQADEARSPSLHDFWLAAWLSASRALTNTSYCRAACYLLKCLLAWGVTKPFLNDQSVIDSVFVDGGNGPPMFTDTVIDLLMQLVGSEYISTEQDMKHISRSALSWLRGYWLILSVPDRSHNADSALYGQPQRLYSLLRLLSGHGYSLKMSAGPVFYGEIHRAAHIDRQDLAFARYLLQENTAPPLSAAVFAISSSIAFPKQSYESHAEVLSMLIAKTADFRRAWDSLEAERTSNINGHIAEVATTACILLLLFTVDDSAGHHTELVTLNVSDLWKKIRSFCSRRTSESYQPFLTRVAQRLLQVDIVGLNINSMSFDRRQEIIDDMLKIMSGSTESQDASDWIEDSMYTEASQNSQSMTSKEGVETTRQDLPMPRTPAVIFAQTLSLLKLEALRIRSSTHSLTEISTQVIDEITDMDDRTLLLSRSIIEQFFDRGLLIGITDASRLLNSIALVCLRESQFARCEAALCFCSNIMSNLAPIWIAVINSDDDAQDGINQLADIAYEIMDYYLNVVLKKGIASNRALFSIARLMDSILKCCPTFSHATLPSPRTILLTILEQGQNNLRFDIAERVSRLFNGYVLSEHAIMFDDIVSSLPSDPDLKEGIAVRLHFLAYLGARWHTVLRQAVYHMFETAAHVLSVTRIAERCLRLMCTHLSLDSPQALFRCFSSQILYTWFEKESIEAIPFSAFGYKGFSDLVRDNKEELAAQIVMRESMEQATQIVQHTGIPWDSVVRDSFSKSLVYGLVFDTTVRRSSQDIGKSESFLITQIGEDTFVSLSVESLPESIGVLFSRLTDDRGFDKGLTQSMVPGAILDRIQEMCNYSSSDAILPPSQQPSFRAKHLVPLLGRLCQHANMDLDQVWSSATVIFVCRTLLDDAKNTYGPLHGCAVLRKLRMLISLAAETVLSGYCLEMLLHNLRPFLTQFHCAEDAFGVFRYLLEHGKRSLLSNLPFLAGLGVSISIAMSNSVKVSRDSTTQEAHYASAMSKAHEFQTWFRKYLNDLSIPDPSSTIALTFAKIMSAATQVTQAGSNSKSSAEGSLLYQLLVDQSRNCPVLSKVFFCLILRSFCHTFTLTEDPSDDIVSAKEDVILLAPVLQSAIFEFEAPESFKIWAATTIGRAYVLCGPEKMIMPKFTETDEGDRLNLEAQQSYRSIILDLTDQLWTDEQTAASAAEQTLQSIFSSIAGDDKLQMSSHLPDRLLCEQFSFTPHRKHQQKPMKRDSKQPILLKSFEKEGDCKAWASCLAVDLCLKSPKDPILTSLTYVLEANLDLAVRLLPSIVHIVLLAEFGSKTVVRDMLSTTLSEMFSADDGFLSAHAALGLDIMLYLRRCCVPSESTMAQRNTWLFIDHQIAAEAAARCNLCNTALLMLEICDSQHKLQSRRASRHSSQADGSLRKALVSKIFSSVDDPDFFYSTLQETDVASIVAKLCHEGDGQKAVSFQSALLDSEIRTDGFSSLSQQSNSATAATLTLANFHGLAQVMNESLVVIGVKSAVKPELNSSFKMQHWNNKGIRSTSHKGSNIDNVFQSLNNASRTLTILTSIDEALLSTIDHLGRQAIQSSILSQSFQSLAVLSELKECMQSNPESFGDAISMRENVKTWYLSTSFENVERLLVGRETMLAALKNNIELQHNLKLSYKQVLLYEIRMSRVSLHLGHEHALSQFCLNRAVYLSKLGAQAEEAGLKVNAAIRYDLANTLWTQNETAESIALLQDLQARENVEGENIAISRSEILTNLGQKLTQARLDRPDEVTTQYLQPAIEALGKHITGSNAGRVFHNFAAFCDQQLHDADYLDEYSRIDKLRTRKKHEVETLEAMKKGKEGKDRDLIRSHLVKAQTWFKLDEQEWNRLKKHREDLVGDCLENYLRAMQACDDFPNDVLRFLALWLDQSVNEEVNKTVSKYLPAVPSIKFAPLVNQLSSRILDTADPFQRQLYELLFRISNEHPYHSLYQIFATSKSKGQKGDTIATSRYKAATKLADAVMRKGSASSIWIAIHNSNIAFVRIATDQVPDKEIKTGSKILLRKFAMGPKLEQTFHDLHHKIPPPTMKIHLRADKDYKSVPALTGFDPSVTIAGGISAPKIISANTSDGAKSKMLLKGGNDDLRQDSIMEQVFEQVSNLLGDHRKTRQRKLGIRTYKVIPLTHNAGIIEFVKDTMPLHDYILPAHTRYYPKDYKPNRCRKEISDAQSKSMNQRLQAYLVVCANFHPVMRFFFMEHFPSPDEWFQKRLNYSRSTAAISMLGHVLGLGDRHGHNILLDTNTGEVVHIDLGVAFEAGRVLPIPEVVPFRLTRDLVDGMGLSGVEGVFRRCCKFTLEALRQDQEAIMTILDVLRWDPLYSWSISPLRLQRMQENEKQAANSEAVAGGATDAGLPNGTGLGGIGKKEMGEPGEADRALAVVAKKLGKSLSVEATVNELIRQAMDEKNLAVLYCGWAAYA